MKNYNVISVVRTYGNLCEVKFTRNGRKYLLMLPELLWESFVQKSIHPTEHELLIEGDEDGEWFGLQDEYSTIDYYALYDSVEEYYKQINK